jgi:hypothetical protein
MKLLLSYVPKADGPLAIWVNTYKEKLGLLGAELGLSPTAIATQQAAAQNLIDSINKVDLKKNELKEAASAKRLSKQTDLKLIRSMATSIKKLPGYTPNMGMELGIIASKQLVDENEVKPVITPVSYIGYVRIGFNKQRMLGIRLYSRLKGEQEWNLLRSIRRPPFIDKTPPREGGKPEVREYRAICFDGLKNKGHWSDIVAVVHGG